MYAIIDIETTGGNPKFDKITEVAVFVHDGTEVVDEFCTLVNPERSIPPYITTLTGISNDMVKGAPKFYEIAKKLVEVTDNHIFIAHNVNFDYNFIRYEFQSLGFDFQRDNLCTVKLSRKLLPGKASYSLGNLCNDLGIQINGRHRAAGDALATVKLFEILLQEKSRNTLFDNIFDYGISQKLHPDFKLDKLKDLPQEAGVYYFYNEKNDLIYIGKSKSIKERIYSHLNNKTTKRAMNMRDEMTDISWEVTGSELVALLYESAEIKKHKPKFNRSQRRQAYMNDITYFKDENGYWRFDITRKDETKPILVSFSTKKAAQEYLAPLVKKHNLCEKLCGLFDASGPCFHYGVQECNGACIGKEAPEEYNLRAEQLIIEHNYPLPNFLIIDKGRSLQEKAVILVRNGKYKGFGYTDVDLMDSGIEYMVDCIKPFEDNKDTQKIIRSYLKRFNVEEIISLED